VNRVSLATTKSSIDRFFFEKFSTTASPPLCEQSQPGHDEIIDRSFLFRKIFDRRFPAVMPMERDKT
jgi:hypothetical protein